MHWKTKWQLLSACLMNLGNGMNDSAPVALIPYVEEDYQIGYAVISFFFIANALGFIMAAPLLHAIEAKLGRCRSYSFSMSLLTIAYISLPVIHRSVLTVATYFMLDFGMAVSIALNNDFCANLANATTALGYFSGAYGLGGIVSPLFATAMVSSGIPWSFCYTISLAVSVFNLMFSGWAFYNFEATAVFTKLLSRRIQISSLSFISVLGNSGGAAFLFLPGSIRRVRDNSAPSHLPWPVWSYVSYLGSLARIQKRSE